MKKIVLILLIILTLITGILIIRYYSIQQNNKEHVKNIIAGCFDGSNRPYSSIITDMVHEGRIHLICPYCNHNCFPVLYGLFEKDDLKQISQEVILGGCMIGAPLECSHCGRRYHYKHPGKLKLDKEHEPSRLEERRFR